MGAVVLRPRDTAPPGVSAFLDATFDPTRGLRLLQARGCLPDMGPVNLLHHADEFGGAILLPFANRIRGRLEPDGRTLDTTVLGRRVPLPVNWHGKHPRAEPCAIHGLVYDAAMRVVESGIDYVVAILDAGDFGGHWPSRTVVQITATL